MVQPLYKTITHFLENQTKKPKSPNNSWKHTSQHPTKESKTEEQL